MIRRGHGKALEVLVDLYESAVAGDGALALVRGGMASGKTELLREFVRLAGEAGALTFSATGSLSERPLRGGVIDQLLCSAGLVREAEAFAAEGVPSAPAGGGRRDGIAEAATMTDSLVREACALFLERARERPVVICVDDVQFADSASLRFLLRLHQRIGRAPITVVLNVWDRPKQTLSAFCAELARRPYKQIRLGGLPRDAVARMAAEAVGAKQAARLVPRLMELSGGNPMVVRALIEDYRTGVCDERGLPVPGPETGRAALAVMHRWEPQLLEVARVLAILGEHADPSLAARLLRTRVEYTGEVVQILTAAGLYADGRFAHEPVASAVREGLAPRELAWMHLRAAELLYQRGAPVMAVADHLVSADSAPGGWAMQVLRDAAGEAMAADRPERAEVYLELAFRSGRDEVERVALVQSLAEVTWRVNPCASAAYLAVARTTARLEPRTPREARTEIRNGLWRGDSDAVERALKQLVADEAMLDPRTAAELRLGLAWYYGPSGGPAREAMHELLTPSGEPWTVVADAMGSLWSRGGSREVVDGAGHILQNCPLSDVSIEALATALVALAHGNETRLAAEWCDLLIAEAERRRGTTWRAFLNAVRSEISLLAGDPCGASLQATAALSLLRPQEWGVLVGYPMACLLEADGARGEHASAAEKLRYLVPDGMYATTVGVRYLFARARYALATGSPLAALADLHACERAVRDRRLDVSALAPIEIGMAEAKLRLGRAEEARDLMSLYLDDSPRTRFRGVALRVFAEAGDPARRADLLRESADELERVGDTLELERTKAVLHRLHGEPGTGIARRSEPEPGADPLEHILSEAERRVAVLAASGHSNRDISRKLWITISTVEQHLTRVYRKLGVSGRRQLADIVESGIVIAITDLVSNS
ncbi:LuxR family transcriptional regulator [Actinomadura sp. WMMA1423]|uniref:helix-turn-helix transcriptional regulator n=1 Tax=Actinomadura sp. WMMA1423 TaxID=2591108 RepID=UPI00143D71A5|nr:LuxR family transcriptional regulator [Actinomadura sp. WMMA1423]